ncbi:pilin [Photobacterium profundum]|uniref:Hypothetical pilin PilA n=1 Tax=Photobacterium profundum (strain SS9) TaxID=298386 RepID=Q6LMH1_PHOPR|nr:prepilin-type N-terminal cleavage/methylation domain-containing protein [Photobacterium profundum]CAG21506.1 hypothetical pilin PilA [Photobacterium profundum SS9]
MKKMQKGFTLIELMIVVAIIGALSAIAIPAYKDYVKKSELAAAVATMKALVTEAELIYQEKGAVVSTTPLTDLGTKADANPLGVISVSADNNLQFKFGDNSASKDLLVTFDRSATGWACTQTTGAEIDSCPAPKS